MTILTIHLKDGHALDFFCQQGEDNEEGLTCYWSPKVRYEGGFAIVTVGNDPSRDTAIPASEIRILQFADDEDEVSSFITR
jgi:hypothetical protein